MKKELLKNTIIAHRGEHNLELNIPENSIPAFQKAIKNKYTIELDVHILKDNTIVVFHDDNLKRMCGIDKEISNCTYKELLKYNLNNTKYRIPKLEHVLKLIKGKVFLLIETKVTNYNGILEEELSKQLDKYKGDFAIQSFNTKSLNWFKKNRPHYLRGLLISDKDKHSKLYQNIIIKYLKVDFISCNYNLLDTKFINKKRYKYITLTWTIRNKDNYIKSIAKADSLICENMNQYLE